MSKVIASWRIPSASVWNNHVKVTTNRCVLLSWRRCAYFHLIEVTWESHTDAFLAFVLFCTLWINFRWEFYALCVLKHCRKHFGAFRTLRNQEINIFSRLLPSKTSVWTAAIWRMAVQLVPSWRGDKWLQNSRNYMEIFWSRRDKSRVFIPSRDFGVPPVCRYWAVISTLEIISW